MRRLVQSAAAAALAIAQIVAAAPAAAAELVASHDAAATRVDAFAGARLRIPFGGREGGKARLSLSAAPALRSADPAAAARTRFGEGVELSLAGGGKAELSLAGYRFGEGGAVDRDGRRLGVSTLGIAAIAGAVIVAGLVATALIARGDE